MKNMIMLWALFTVCGILNACTQDSPKTSFNKEEIVPFPKGEFAKGADVSWLTQLESEGYSFHSSDGTTKECMTLLKEDCGVNAIRLRVWVNPVDGWNNMEDVIIKAKRADALGMRIMIDFHYSDTWADPGHQATPAAWADMDMEQLTKAVSAHTTELLSKLKDCGVEPEWVQIGNETRGGFLYPLGEASNKENFTRLVNAGYDAAKAVFPDCLAMVHLDGGDQLHLYTYIFSILEEQGGRYDMIGMSLYPEADSWQKTADACLANIQTLAATYNVPLMICEIGLHYAEAEKCRQLISYLMERRGDHLKGIFYWEPEAPEGYNGGYEKGCFVKGTPTVALDAFKE